MAVFVHAYSIEACFAQSKHAFGLEDSTLSIFNSAYTLRTCRSFQNVAPENLLDITLFVIPEKEGELWPQMRVDSVYHDGHVLYPEHESTRYLRAKGSPCYDCGESTFLFPPRAYKSEVLCLALYPYLCPVKMAVCESCGVEGYRFLPGLIKPGFYRLFLTFERYEYPNERPWVQHEQVDVTIGPTRMSARTQALVDSFRNVFVPKIKTYSYEKRNVGWEPLCDSSFITGVRSCMDRDPKSTELLLAMTAQGLLFTNYWENNSGCPTGIRQYEKLYLDRLKKVVADDPLASLLLMLRGPIFRRTEMLDILKLDDPRGCNGNIVPLWYMRERVGWKAAPH